MNDNGTKIKLNEENLKNLEKLLGKITSDKLEALTHLIPEFNPKPMHEAENALT